MPNFVLYLLFFGLGALWMQLKCRKAYNSPIFKANLDLELEKVKFQQEKIRADTQKLLDDQIGVR